LDYLARLSFTEDSERVYEGRGGGNRTSVSKQRASKDCCLFDQLFRYAELGGSAVVRADEMSVEMEEVPRSADTELSSTTRDEENVVEDGDGVVEINL
jgi:hypothetical protein